VQLDAALAYLYSCKQPWITMPASPYDEPGGVSTQGFIFKASDIGWKPGTPAGRWVIQTALEAQEQATIDNGA